MSYSQEKNKNKVWKGTLYVRTQGMSMRFLTILNCNYTEATTCYKPHFITGCILPQYEQVGMCGILLHASRLFTPHQQLLF